ncbi:DUF6199 family natural product biosynthesis protein [Streptomyces uncialis]|uniref:DUF6199 family natural product biosynthesis protein n=1 Tax=Streptomyces uncialis TaxID=1048205 RepID=UPI002258BC0E|nr:DUF6199 family natural product biosynthesis protein [Streptomyces uncialis]MCX4661746.1 DUF6199 family natural product biosynthesis protein [Streptomyces uncialis]
MNIEASIIVASDGNSNPVLIPLLCLFLVMGLLQVLRPQLLWKLNRNFQRGWVKDPDATEPTGKGYAMQRATGAVFLAFVIWMLVQQI